MKMDNRKIVLIGTGMVGMSFAYAALNQNACDELVLIDINRERAIGEAMDLNHGLAFSGTSMRIYAGDYNDCSDADIVVICAGVNQKEGESRLELLSRNAQVFESIIKPVVKSGFSGIFLVATNPVDIMTRITYQMSGFDSHKVIGTGTTLDTARLRYLLGKYFLIDPRNIHAYVIGEHGDSEFVPWSQALIATKPLFDVINDNKDKFKISQLDKIEHQVRTSAQEIIKAKSATYYGIGMAIVRIIKAIFQNENSVLTVSSQMCGAYGVTDTFIGNPCIINRLGISSILELSLERDEAKKLRESASLLSESYNSLGF
ncbi:MAG: L-lactate dehydrogenase [Eubacteriales bacterium]|nr:L-lactate dehydrogenase [Eubacteriales bacterium]